MEACSEVGRDHLFLHQHLLPFACHFPSVRKVEVNSRQQRCNHGGPTFVLAGFLITISECQIGHVENGRVITHPRPRCQPTWTNARSDSRPLDLVSFCRASSPVPFRIALGIPSSREGESSLLLPTLHCSWGWRATPGVLPELWAPQRQRRHLLYFAALLWRVRVWKWCVEYLFRASNEIANANCKTYHLSQSLCSRFLFSPPNTYQCLLLRCFARPSSLEWEAISMESAEQGHFIQMGFSWEMFILGIVLTWTSCERIWAHQRGHCIQW